jgi:hypothetical protein
VFFVPYDLGMDASTRSSDGALAKTSCPRMTRALELLYASPYFQKYRGADHVVLHSINQPMVYFANQHCRRWYESCWNCTKLSIDAYSGDIFRNLDPALTHRWISIPFPSDYHLSDAVTVMPWADRIETQREFAVAFSGSVGVTAKKGRHLREVIIETCTRVPMHCFLHTLKDHSSNVLTGHVQRSASERRSQKGLGPYYDASFCLMPGGDFPTRKAVLDALLTGCVPVVFQHSTAHSQWPWHWGSREEAEGVLEYVPMEEFVLDPMRHIDALVKMSQDTVLMKQKRQKISALGSRMQYSLPGHNSAKRIPIAKDAADVILEHLATGRLVYDM